MAKLLNIDCIDILEYLEGKLFIGSCYLALPDRFLRAVERDKNWRLFKSAHSCCSLPARELFSKLINHMTRTGQPYLIESSENTLNQAAIKIQAAFRGWKVRMASWNPHSDIGNKFLLMYAKRHCQELLDTPQ